MTQETVRKAVSYARVSSRGQEDKLSIKTQFEDNGHYAVRTGLHVVKQFQDVGSGLSTKERPEFKGMVEYVLDTASGITDVIFYDLDRFTRRNRDFYEYTEKLEEAGISLHSVAEGRTYSQDSALTWKFKAIINEDYSRSTSTHTKRGQRGAVRNGYYIGPKAPWGYEKYYVTVGKEQHAKLQPNRSEWEDCLNLWKMAVGGRTPMEITKEFNARGIPSPIGGPWTDDAVRYILRNPHYKGETVRGLRLKSKLPGPPATGEVAVGENAHVAAVSHEDFEKVQELIRSRHRSQGPTRSHSSPNPLSGLAKCGTCAGHGRQSNMTITTKEGVVRLQCARKKKQGKGACDGKNVRLDRLMEAVVSRMLNHILTPEVILEQIESVAAESKRHVSEQENRKSNIGKRLKELAQGIKNVNDVLIAEGARNKNLNSLLDKLNEMETDRETLNREIQEINEATEEAARFISDPDGIVATALDLRTYTESKDPTSLRELVKMLIERVEVYPDYGKIYYALPVPCAGAEGDSSPETVNLAKASTRSSDESCTIQGFMGIDPIPRTAREVTSWFPRTRGDRPYG